MTVHELGDRLRDKLAEQFLTWQERADGVLFRGRDPKHPGRLLTLLITVKAWADYKDELPEAVDRAIGLLRGNGGYVVIREDRGGELVVVRKSALAA
jgi:hypothetical protein